MVTGRGEEGFLSKILVKLCHSAVTQRGHALFFFLKSFRNGFHHLLLLPDFTIVTKRNEKEGAPRAVMLASN